MSDDVTAGRSEGVIGDVCGGVCACVAEVTSVEDVSKVLWRAFEKCGLASHYSLDACQEFIKDFVHFIKEAEGKSVTSEKKARKAIAPSSPTEEGPLPSSILANQQPYMHRHWRKQPYDKRCVRSCVADGDM